MTLDLGDADNERTVGVGPTLGQLPEIVLHGVGCCVADVFPCQSPTAVDGKVEVYDLFVGTVYFDYMADGGKTEAFASVLGRVDGRLHQLHEGGRRLAESAVQNDKFDGAADGQLTLGSRKIHRIEPVLYFFRYAGKGFKPCIRTFRREKTRRCNVRVPCPIYLDSTHTGDGVDLFDVVLPISTESLRMETAEVALPEYFGSFFVFARNEQSGDCTGLKALDVFDGNTGVAVVVASLARCFAGDLVYTGGDTLGDGIVQRPNGESSPQWNFYLGGGGGQLQNCSRCSLRGKPPLCSSPDEVFPAGRVCKAVVEGFFHRDVQVDQFHGSGGVGVPDEGAFPGVQISGNAGHLALQNGFIGLFRHSDSHLRFGFDVTIDGVNGKCSGDGLLVLFKRKVVHCRDAVILQERFPDAAFDFRDTEVRVLSDEGVKLYAVVPAVDEPCIPFGAEDKIDGLSNSFFAVYHTGTIQTKGLPGTCSYSDSTPKVDIRFGGHSHSPFSSGMGLMRSRTTYRLPFWIRARTTTSPSSRAL